MIDDQHSTLLAGSRAGVEPAGQLAAYSAAKAGVVALTKAIADKTKATAECRLNQLAAKSFNSDRQKNKKKAY